MIICYPIVIEKTNDLYEGFFPDLEGIKVKSKTIEETLIKAKEELGLYLLENEDVKEPSDPDDVKLEEGQLFFYIDINMNWVREKDKYKSITRAITLPKWLNEKAKESGINVSMVLQRALMETLNIKEED